MVGAVKRPDSGLVALTVGMLGSGAANVTWAWSAGPVHVVAGIFATALVPTSLHLWPRVPIASERTRWIRAGVMSYICAAAAGVNLIHATWLLTDYRPMDTFILESRVVEVPAQAASWVEIVMAVLLITAVEAVMVMASLARRATPAQTKRQKRTPAPPVTAGAKTPEPIAEQTPEVALAVGVDEPEELARARQLVTAGRQGGRQYGRAKLARDLGVTSDRARQLLKQIDADRPVHLVETG